MMVLYLFKNGELELTLNGIIDDKKMIFDNIIYDKENMILIREDASFKYIIDFNNNKASIELKEYNQNLSLLVQTLEKELTSNTHKIKYIIESEDNAINELVIIF